MPSTFKKFRYFDQLPNCGQGHQQSQEEEKLPSPMQPAKCEPVRKRAHDDSTPMPPSYPRVGHTSSPPPKTSRPPREFVPDWSKEFNMNREDVMKVLGVYGSTNERMLLIGKHTHTTIRIDKRHKDVWMIHVEGWRANVELACDLIRSKPHVGRIPYGVSRWLTAPHEPQTRIKMLEACAQTGAFLDLDKADEAEVTMTILGRPEAVLVVLHVINKLVVKEFPISSMAARWLSMASNDDKFLARIRQNVNNTHATITPDPWRHRDAPITMFVVGENAEDVERTVEQIDLDGIVSWNLFPPRDAADFFEGDKDFDTIINRVGKHFVIVGRRENVKQTKEEVGLVLQSFARRSVPSAWL